MIVCLSIFAARAVLAYAEESENSTPTEWNATSRSAGNRPSGSAGFGESFREGPMGGIWQRSSLLGDTGGIRSTLGRLGITLNAQETSEVLGNLTGGIRKGFAYDGLTTLSLQINTKRAFNHYGGLFNASALQVHGLNLSTRNLGSEQTSSGITADDGLRLWELWYQQKFDFNQLDIRVGNQSLDQEFIVSQYAGLFVNTMFGWPMLTSVDMLGGGPAYPLASLGIRARYVPTGQPWGFLLGLFDDNPSGVNPQASPAQDPQKLNSSGTHFRLKDKPLVIGEVQFSKPAVGQLEYAGEEAILPATYKLGFWYDFGRFADQRYGSDGRSLADSQSNGLPNLVQGNLSFYFVADQLIWRKTAESAEGVGFFIRAMGAPSTQNPIDYSLNAGLNWHAPLKHRDYDAAGLGMGLAHTSGRARALVQDNISLSGAPNIVPRTETFLEATYQYQIVQWWLLQPDVQYIFNPGGGIVNPANGATPIAGELVIGLRTNIVL